MEKGKQQRTWRSWISGLLAVVMIIAMFPVGPGRALAAGTLSVTTSVPDAVAGDTTDINLSYTNSAVLNLNLGALDFHLPTGLKATTSDQINGVNLTPSQILDGGQRVRISGLSLTLLKATSTLSLKQKTMPTPGNYNFEARIYGLTLTVINTTPSETQVIGLSIGALSLSLGGIEVINNPGDADTVTLSGVKTGDVVKIYNPDASLRTQLTAQSDGTLTVPVALNPAGGTVSISQTRGGVESLRLPVIYLAEIVPPVLLTSVYVSNQSGNADSVTVNDLNPGDSVRLYTSLTGTQPLATSSPVAAGQTSVVVPTTLTPLGGIVYVSRVRSDVESVRTLVPYLPEVVAALTSNLVALTNGSGNSDQVRVTGLTPGDIVRVYATDGTLLNSLTANSGGIAQGTVALTPGGGTVNLVLLRNGVESLALPVAYVAETVRSLLSSDIVITNNKNDSDVVTVTGLQEGDRIVLAVGTGTPITSPPAGSNGSIDLPAALLPNGGSVTLNILRNTIEGPKLTLLYDPEKVDAPLTSQITPTNNSGDADRVSVGGLEAGDEILVYASADATTELGRATAVAGGSSASASAAVTLTPAGGTVYVAIQRHGVVSTRTAAAYSTETVAAPALNTVTVTNNTAGSDSIAVTGLQAGDKVRVYEANGTTLIGEASAVGSGGAYSASLTGRTLVPAGGNVRVSIVRNTIESAKTTVTYNAEYVAPPPPATITVTNNANPAADTVRVGALQAGDSIRIYQNGTRTAEVPAAGTAASANVTLNGAGSTLSVSIVRNGVESTTTTVTYPAEIPNFAGSVSVVNGEGDSDTFTLTGMTAGTAVTVYPQADGTGTALNAGTVDANGTLILPVTLVPGGSTLSFVFTPPSSGASAPIAVTYGPEPVTPPSMDSIAPANNTGSADTVTISNLNDNDTVTIFGVSEDGTLSEIGTGSANGPAGSASAAVNLELVPAGGTIAVTITRGGLTSEATRVNYPSEVVNAPAVADITVANLTGTGSDSVKVDNLTNGDSVTVRSYSAGSTLIETQTAIAAGTSAQADLPLAPAGGYVTVTITRNTIVSSATTANYSAETVPAPEVGQIAVLNNADTAADRVTVQGLAPNDYAEIVSYNAADVEIDRKRVPAQGGEASALIALAPAGGHVTAAIIRYSTDGTGGLSSATTRVSYSAEVVPPPAAGTIAVRNNSGSGDTVAVSGLNAGDQIRVYTADGTTELGRADVSGTSASANVTLVPGGGVVRVTIVRSGLESTGTQVSYGGEVVPAPEASGITVVNAAGTSADTVTVSGLEPGDVINVYEGADLLGTGTVAAGAASVQIPAVLRSAGGIVQVTITRNTITGPVTGVPYAAEVVPAPAAAEIAVSNVSNTGALLDTVTVTGVTAGEIVHVYDSSYTEIGSSPSNGAIVTVGIPGNLAPAGGSLLVRIERGGLFSAYVPVTYEAETIEPIEQNAVSATNTTGDVDAMSVSGLNAGESVRVYRANGVLLTTQPYTANPTVFNVEFAPEGETLTLIRVRDGIESVGIAFTVEAEAVPAVDAVNVTATNNAGARDTVEVAVAVGDYEAGDVYVAYDESLNELGRSDAYVNGMFIIPVTLLPTGGTVQVALERRGVTGQASGVTYAAEAAAPAQGPVAADITVTNDQGGTDPVVVDNVETGDVVVVYNADGTEIGRATAAADGSVTVLVNLADASGGTVQVSIVRGGAESARTPQTYAAYDPNQPEVPAAAQVSILRSTDPADEDEVTVTGLEAEDVVEFFDDEDTSIGTADANDSGVAVLRTLRLKSYASTLKLNVLREGSVSGPLAVAYPAQATSVAAPASGDITVNNAAGTSSDTVTVTGVFGGDRVRVYTPNGAVLLGEATASGTSAVVPVQLSAAAGSVRVNIVRGGVQSAGTLKPYAAEPVVTPAPAAADISVVNAPGTASDTVTLLGVQSGDIVRVYAAGSGTELGERTASGTEVIVPVALTASGGSVEVTVERGGFESTRTTVAYGAEAAQAPAAPAAASIEVTNETGEASDTVTVTNVQAGDLVRVFEGGGPVAIGQASATGSSVTIPSALQSAGGTVTVTIERGGAQSARSAAVTYGAEPLPEPPAASNITVTNAAGTTSDRVVIVEGVQAFDLVRVYNEDGSVLLGQLTSSGTTVTIPVELTPGGGSVRVTIERGGAEGPLSTPVPYTAEPTPEPPAAPAAGSVTVTNNVGTSADTVVVADIRSGDIVRVYAANGTTLLGQHASTGTSTTVAVALSAPAGTVRVSIERGGVQSALSAAVNYAAEPAAPDAPAVGSVTATNNVGTLSDSVAVAGIQSGDIVRVYAADGTTLLGQHTSTGTNTTVPVALGAPAGTVRVSIERGGQLSALSGAVAYAAEPAAPQAPAANTVTVTNDPGTISDTVVVTGVQSGDIVRVYAANGTTLLGQHASTGTSSTVAVALGAPAGTVRVTIERSGQESALSAQIGYAAEIPAVPAPDAPAVGDVQVTNAVGTTADSVVVADVQSGDIVRVYAADGTTLLGQHTSTGTSATVIVALGEAAGTVRVSIERDGVRSDLSAPVNYAAEPTPPTPVRPDAPDAADISAVNNPGTADSVRVEDVQSGDIVRVYAANGTTLLGQATAGTNSVDIPVTLSAGTGTVNVTITRNGLESLPQPKNYAAENVPALDPASFTVTTTVYGSGLAAVSDNDLIVGDTVILSGGSGEIARGTVTSGGSVNIAIPDGALNPSGGTFEAVLERAGQRSTPVTVNYGSAPSGPVEAPTLAQIATDPAAGTVTVNGLQEGDTITVTDGAGGIQTSEPAGSDGTATVDEVVFSPEGGTLQIVVDRGGDTSAPVTVAYAAETPDAPGAAAIAVVNAPGTTNDTVTVDQLTPGDRVLVYDFTGTNLIGQGTAGSAILAIPVALADTAGQVQVSIVRNGLESAKTPYDYTAAAAPSVPAPPAADIAVENNAGSDDRVVVQNVLSGDLVTVYAADGTTILGQEKATANGPLTIDVTLGTASGEVQVALTRGEAQSTKTTAPYTAEASSVPAPSAGSIDVDNNAGNADTVVVRNVQAGDIVTVYASNGTTILGQVTATANGSVTVNVTLGTAAGDVLVAITRGGVQSARTTVGYAAEASDVPAPPAADVTVDNDTGSTDSVIVKNVQIGDIVTVYASNGTTILGQETATANGDLTVNVTLSGAEDEVQVAITRGGVQSEKTTVGYTPEASSVPAPPEAGIVVTNNTGSGDTVVVPNVQIGDIVTVYAANGITILGQETATQNGPITISVTLNAASDLVQVAITRGAVQSAKTTKEYAAEPSSVPAPPANAITVTNNTGSSDTVIVSGMEIGDIVTVYAADGVTVIGQGTATEAGTLTIGVTLNAGAGDVRVAVTRGTIQSAKTPKGYTAEPSNLPAPSAGDVTVVNNLGAQDSVTIRSVQAGDTITVYAANGTTVLARVTAETSGDLTIPVTLPENSGTVNVTVSRGGVESLPASPAYTAEPTALAAPAAGSITVTNNTGSSDAVVLTGLQAGDTIIVYAANGTTILDRITVGSDPASWTVPVTLIPGGGSVQVSILRGGIESARTTIDYGAETSSVPAPAAVGITVTNNGGAGSSVIVSNVQPGDIVTVYAENGTTVIGRAQVQPGATSVAIPVVLDEAGGNVQVTLTRGTVQSAPTAVAYAARVEPQPGTGGGGGDGGGGFTPADPAGPVAPPAPAPNPVTPETNPVTPETEGEGEEIDAPGRIVSLTVRAPRTFNDISGYWAQPAIERLASLGVIDGNPDGSFAPREGVSRAQFTKMVATLLGIQSKNAPIFADTPANRWYTESIQGAYEQGIVNGYKGGSFEPDEPVTREEMAKILMNAMLWLNPDVFANDPDYSLTEAFRDSGKVGKWAEEPVSRMLEEGILLGKTNGVLDPKGNATRAEAAAVLIRLMERMSDNFDF